MRTQLESLMKLNNQTIAELERADRKLLICTKIYACAMIIAATAHLLLFISWVTI